MKYSIILLYLLFSYNICLTPNYQYECIGILQELNFNNPITDINGILTVDNINKLVATKAANDIVLFYNKLKTGNNPITVESVYQGIYDINEEIKSKITLLEAKCNNYLEANNKQFKVTFELDMDVIINNILNELNLKPSSTLRNKYKISKSYSTTKKYLVNGKEISEEEFKKLQSNRNYKVTTQKVNEQKYFINGKEVTPQQYNEHNFRSKDTEMSYELNGKKVSEAEYHNALKRHNKIK